MIVKLLIIEHAKGRADGIRDFFVKTRIRNIKPQIYPVYKYNKLPDISRVDALILSGGPMGIYDLQKKQYSYLLEEIPYIEAAIALRKPILGICFGHQLLAHILGGDVIRKEESREFGWFNVDILDKQSPIFCNLPSVLNVFQFHNDHVIEKPACSKILASSTLCGIQAISYENLPIYSVQFHPEINFVYGNSILEMNRLPKQKLKLKNMDIHGSQILMNFIQNVVFKNCA